MNTGWKCPDCGGCYSPSTPKCWVCPKVEAVPYGDFIYPPAGTNGIKPSGECLTIVGPTDPVTSSFCKLSRDDPNLHFTGN